MTRIASGPDERSPAANLYDLRRDPVGFFTMLTRRFGDIARFSLGAQHEIFFVNHPELIKEVLVAQDRNFTKWFAVARLKDVLGEGLFVSEGAFHARQRKLSQ